MDPVGRIEYGHAWWQSLIPTLLTRGWSGFALTIEVTSRILLKWPLVKLVNLTQKNTEQLGCISMTMNVGELLFKIWLCVKLNLSSISHLGGVSQSHKEQVALDPRLRKKKGYLNRELEFIPFWMIEISDTLAKSMGLTPSWTFVMLAYGKMVLKEKFNFLNYPKTLIIRQIIDWGIS